jgi:hypothetical protein
MKEILTLGTHGHGIKDLLLELPLTNWTQDFYPIVFSEKLNNMEHNLLSALSFFLQKKIKDTAIIG